MEKKCQLETFATFRNLKNACIGEPLKAIVLLCIIQPINLPGLTMITKGSNGLLKAPYQVFPNTPDKTGHYPIQYTISYYTPASSAAIERLFSMPGPQIGTDCPIKLEDSIIGRGHIFYEGYLICNITIFLILINNQ